MQFDYKIWDGYYDKYGVWQRTKYCFKYCGESCTCKPPDGKYKKTKEELEKETFIDSKSV